MPELHRTLHEVLSRRRVPGLSTLALVAASALVVVLAMRVRSLRQDVTRLAAAREADYAADFVPSVPARTLRGEDIVLGAPVAGAQLLYFFTTTCPHCQASIPTVRALAGAPAAHQLVGVSESSEAETRKYVESAGFSFPVARLPDDRARALFRARDVPLLLVVDSGGRVRYRHVGDLSEQHAKAALAAAAPLSDSTMSPTQRN